MPRQTKILFISKHIVNNSIAMAGHQSFNYYLNQFCDDSAFDVGYMVVHKGDEQYKKMKRQFVDRAREFSIFIPKICRILTYIYYNSFVRIGMSLINPKWYYLDPIYSYFYKRCIKDLRKKQWTPDIVVFEWTEMIFLNDFFQTQIGKTFSIATEHDLSFIKLHRRYQQNKFLKLFFVNRFMKNELEVLKRIDKTIVLSIDDKLRLHENGVSNVLLLSPYFRSINISQEKPSAKIIFYGAMNRIENQEAVAWFIDKVFVPFGLFNSFSFVIIGSGTPKKFESKYLEIKKVVFLGYVEKPETIFATALCMVVPLTNGAGIKIKIIEAMSCSVPVLTNNIGIEGIKANDGISYLHCELPSDYSNNIAKLSNETGHGRTIGENARKLIQENFNFQESYIEYVKVATSSTFNT